MLPYIVLKGEKRSNLNLILINIQQIVMRYNAMR